MKKAMPKGMPPKEPMMPKSRGMMTPEEHQKAMTGGKKKGKC